MIDGNYDEKMIMGLINCFYKPEALQPLHFKGKKRITLKAGEVFLLTDRWLLSNDFLKTQEDG
jgi:hypothetical protein